MPREVWVAEEPDGEVYDCHTDKQGMLDHIGHPRQRIVRYVPEPQLVEGWPKESGWYWCLPRRRSEPTILWATTTQAYPADGDYINREEWPDTPFWGPLEPPRVEP